MLRIETVRSQLQFKKNAAPNAFMQKQRGYGNSQVPKLNQPMAQPVHFQGKPPQTASTGRSDSKPVSPKTLPIIEKLFGQPRKNMMWTLGYSVGGVMLLPIPPVATGAFCLALVHLASATYQFLNQKTEPQVSPASSSSS